MSRFQKLIGILRWEVELGRIDIQIEFVFLSQYQVLPQEDHTEALYLISDFLLNNPNKILAMVPSVTNVYKYLFNLNADWGEFYGGVVVSRTLIRCRRL